MTTAYIYPGLNGLLRRTDRHRFLHLPEVQARFRQAEETLEERLGLKVSFLELIEQPTEKVYAIENISLAAVAICCIQSGVSDRLRKLQPEPEWVMGCSLGDLARAIFAGAYDFDDAVTNHVRFTKGIDGIDQIGRNIGVLAPKGKVFTDEDFAWFDSIQVDVSRLTPRFLNVGGRFAELELLQKRADEQGWNTMPILEYPAHSRYILPYVERVAGEFGTVSAYEPRIPIFSSFSCRPLTDPEDIKKEFLLSITQTIHWHKAVTDLVREKGVRRFVNIGPCRSLSGMMRDIPVEIEMVEADALLS